MPDEPKAVSNETSAPAPAEPSASEQDQDTDVGDFITRQVLDKDSVFFEG